MSPEADEILDVYRARGLRAGTRIHPADFGDAIVWERGFVRHEPVRQALAELFEGGYLIEYEAAFELTDKGEQRIHESGNRRQAIDVEKLSKLLQDCQAESDLRSYFGVGLGEGQLPPFTGGRFELLADGGDRPDVRNEFSPADLLAVELLSVRVPAEVSLDLLDGPLAKQAAAGCLQSR